MSPGRNVMIQPLCRHHPMMTTIEACINVVCETVDTTQTCPTDPIHDRENSLLATYIVHKTRQSTQNSISCQFTSLGISSPEKLK